jgi:AcrR family transcriptional regulator
MNSAGDGRDERGEETRQALLAAARRAFARHGRRAASVRQIASEAGVHPALVTYHFGTKDELYRRVLDRAMAGLRERILDALSGATSPASAGRAVLRAYVDHLATDPDVPRLVQRGLLDEDATTVAVVHEHLSALLTQVPTLGWATPDALLSLFGAAVAPVLYAPVLSLLYAEDPRTEVVLERRQRHLEALVDALVALRSP